MQYGLRLCRVKQTFTYLHKRAYASVTETQILSSHDAETLLTGNPFGLQSRRPFGRMLVTGVDPFGYSDNSQDNKPFRVSSIHNSDNKNEPIVPKMLLGSTPDYLQTGWDHVSLGWSVEMALGKSISVGIERVRSSKNLSKSQDEIRESSFEGTLVQLPKGSRVKSVTCGYRSSYYIIKPMFADQDMLELHVGGNPALGRLGISVEEPNHDNSSLFHITSIKTPVEVAAGYDHALVLTRNGQIYVTGNNADGQLGLSTEQSYLDSFQQLEIHPFIEIINGGIQCIRASADMSGFLTRDGSVFVWGNCEYGQLGENNVTRIDSPTEVSLSRSLLSGRIMKDFQFGDSFVVFLDDVGSVYTMGKGALGAGPDMVSSNDLIHIESLDNLGISRIAAGPGYAVAIADEPTADNKLDIYVWGMNSPTNRLGLSEFNPKKAKDMFVDSPRKLSIPLAAIAKDAEKWSNVSKKLKLVDIALWHDGMVLSIKK